MRRFVGYVRYAYKEGCFVIRCTFVKSVTFVDRSSLKVSRLCRVDHLCKMDAFVGCVVMIW